MELFFGRYFILKAFRTYSGFRTRFFCRKNKKELKQLLNP